MLDIILLGAPPITLAMSHCTTGCRRDPTIGRPKKKRCWFAQEMGDLASTYGCERLFGQIRTAHRRLTRLVVAEACQSVPMMLLLQGLMPVYHRPLKPSLNSHSTTYGTEVPQNTWKPLPSSFSMHLNCSVSPTGRGATA